MTVLTDPEGNETEALFALVDLGDAEVLEIGCGDGRLTWRYADRTAHVTAIDPFEDGIARAKHQLPERLKGTIDLWCLAFEDFAATTQSAVFDVAILPWSLCCMPHGGMVHALEEIHRLLRPVGTLIEIHPGYGAWVEVRSDTGTPFVEFDPGFDSDEVVSAENAVRTVVDRGLFALDADREFELLWYASSVRELRDHVAMVGGYDETTASPRITRLRDQLYRRAQETMDRLRADALVVYREQARISRLIPSGSDSPGRAWPRTRPTKEVSSLPHGLLVASCLTP